MARVEREDVLRHLCIRQLMLFNKVGILMPLFLRRRATTWLPHTVVFFWAMLFPYITQTREAVGTLWGRPFARLAYKSIKLLLKHSPNDGILLRDPDRERGADFRVDRFELERLKAEARLVWRPWKSWA